MKRTITVNYNTITLIRKDRETESHPNEKKYRRIEEHKFEVYYKQ